MATPNRSGIAAPAHRPPEGTQTSDTSVSWRLTNALDALHDALALIDSIGKHQEAGTYESWLARMAAGILDRTTDDLDRLSFELEAGHVRR